MSKECAKIHKLANGLQRHFFPFEDHLIPPNGLYILFQTGELGHNQDRIVRVGTHTGERQLKARLKQHFITPNKDRSIFRKNIGRAVLNKRNDHYLQYWDIDLTTRKARDEYDSKINHEYQKEIEMEVSRYIQDNFSFVVFEVDDKIKRLSIESKLISTISLCDECNQSYGWLGNNSTKSKIVDSGLWLVNELYKTPFTSHEIAELDTYFS
jgi:hypothetical protein